jgi:DNA-directed RNA polymerase specialized sigma24 family protein
VEKKSKAQIFLERVEMFDAIVENKLIEQRQWRELAENITANIEGERVQTSMTSTSKMADAVIKCVMMEDEIAKAVDKLIAEKRKVTHTLEKLYSPTEYKILHMRYIQHISLTDIAEKVNKEYTWVTTNHGRALKHLQNILERRADNEQGETD